MKWIDISEKKPPPHERVLFQCTNGEIYHGTPCYGMHAPWWIADTSLFKGEAIVLNDTLTVDQWAVIE